MNHTRGWGRLPTWLLSAGSPQSWSTRYFESPSLARREPQRRESSACARLECEQRQRQPRLEPFHVPSIAHGRPRVLAPERAGPVNENAPQGGALTDPAPDPEPGSGARRVSPVTLATLRHCGLVPIAEEVRPSPTQPRMTIDREYEKRLSGLTNGRAAHALQGGLKGVEKESLRVTPDGQISKTPHPARWAPRSPTRTSPPTTPRR